MKLKIGIFLLVAGSPKYVSLCTLLKQSVWIFNLKAIIQIQPSLTIVSEIKFFSQFFARFNFVFQKYDKTTSPGAINVLKNNLSEKYAMRIKRRTHTDEYTYFIIHSFGCYDPKCQYNCRKGRKKRRQTICGVRTLMYASSVQRNVITNIMFIVWGYCVCVQQRTILLY